MAFASLAVFLLGAVRCSGRLLAPGAGVNTTVNNHFLDRTDLDKEMKHLASVLGADKKVNATAPAKRALKAAKPAQQAMTVEYSPFTCKKLFAYADSRDVCVRLQPLLCGKECEKILPAGGEVGKCADVQKTVCAIQKHSKASAPVELPGHAASGNILTFCNAYPTQAVISIQHDKYYALEDPEPFLPGLKYLECKQALIPTGEGVNIFLGNFPAAKHVAGSSSAIIMIGQYKLGELKMGVTVYSFKDEGYRRPVVCNAYPEDKLGTAVAGRDWHPYVNAKHPRSLKYMECEKLGLDHADSQKDPESIEFSVDGKVKGHALISPVHTLYVVGSKGDEEKTLEFKEYHFEHGSIREAKE